MFCPIQYICCVLSALLYFARHRKNDVNIWMWMTYHFHNFSPLWQFFFIVMKILLHFFSNILVRCFEWQVDRSSSIYYFIHNKWNFGLLKHSTIPSDDTVMRAITSCFFDEIFQPLKQTTSLITRPTLFTKILVLLISIVSFDCFPMLLYGRNEHNSRDYPH